MRREEGEEGGGGGEGGMEPMIRFYYFLAGAVKWQQQGCQRGDTPWWGRVRIILAKGNFGR